MVQFIITPETAAQLERRKVELERRMVELRDEHQRVCRQLEAIPLFLAEVNGGEPPAPEPAPTAQRMDRTSSEEMSLPMAITYVLQKRGRLTPLEIKDAVVQEGLPPDRFGAQNSYLYTALGRLVERGRIQRVRNKYQLPPGVTIQFAPSEEDMKPGT